MMEPWWSEPRSVSVGSGDLDEVVFEQTPSTRGTVSGFGHDNLSSAKLDVRRCQDVTERRVSGAVAMLACGNPTFAPPDGSDADSNDLSAGHLYAAPVRHYPTGVAMI